MKVVFRNTSVVFAAKKTYKKFSGSDNETANQYLNTIIIINDSNYTPKNHWKINNWVTSSAVASWQIFDDSTLIATLNVTTSTDTEVYGAAKTDNGNFELKVQGDIKSYANVLKNKAKQDGSFANGINDLSDTINYFPNGEN